MAAEKDNRGKRSEIVIGPHDGYNRTEEKRAEISALVTAHHKTRSPERIRKNEMLSVQYRMEEYLNDERVAVDNICTIEDFVKDFLTVLGISRSKFAGYIDTDLSNLNKYFRAERKFNIDLALKFAHFFHTSADIWLMVQIKNDLLLLQSEQDEKYRKYDYETIIS